MTYPTPAHDPACRIQLQHAVGQLYRRASSILGEQHEATPTTTASYLADTLTADDAPEAMAQLCAIQIVHDLLDKAVADDVAFWGSALGRAIVWHVGWPGSHEVLEVPPPVVAAVLGVSRQRAHQLGKVWSDDLRARLREGWSWIQSRGDRATLRLVR